MEEKEKNDIYETLTQMSIVDGFEIDKAANDDDILLGLQIDHPGLTQDMLIQIIKEKNISEKDAIPGENKKIIPIVGSDVIRVYVPPESNKIVRSDIINKEMAEYTKQISKIEGEADDIKLVEFASQLPLEMYNKLIKNAEKFITADHVKWIEHKSGEMKGKKTPYLGAFIAKDIVAMAKNISVKVNTQFVPVPRLDDVLVICTCTIFDSNRNTLVDGIVASQYLFKKRTISEGEDDVSFGEEGTVEKCCTICIRRALEFIIPPFVMKQLLQIAIEKSNAAMQINSGNVQQKQGDKPQTPRPGRIV